MCSSLSRKWTIKVLEAAPSMNMREYSFEGSYSEAVAATHEFYRTYGRTTYLYSRNDNHWWHRAAAGIGFDRNGNAGIPAEQPIAAKAGESKKWELGGILQ